MTESTDTTYHYFVDEAGDTTLFNKHKHPAKLGDGGASRYFMVGVARLDDPDSVAEKIEALRKDLIADPTLKNIPSIRKSEVCFHAKDDFQAVRREVFRLLETIDFSMHVAVRRKKVLINQAQLLFATSGKKMTESVIYDDLIKRLFKNLLHRADENKIIFAKRGKTFSNASLRTALGRAQENFQKSHGVAGHNNHDVIAAHPKDYVGLQVVDYALWALQRMYEREEDYYFQKISSKFKIIMDLDDTRNKGYGEWYSSSNKLTLEKVRGAG